MGAEQIIYANRTADVSRGITTQNLPQNSPEVIDHSKKILAIFYSETSKDTGEIKARKSLDQLATFYSEKEIIHEGFRKKFERIRKPKENLEDVVKRIGMDEEADFDLGFLSKLDDLIPLRGNRAYALSQMIFNPENFPLEFSELLKTDDTFARQLLIKALSSDNDYYTTDIKTDLEKRKLIIKSNEELIKKFEEKISTPDSGGLT